MGLAPGFSRFKGQVKLLPGQTLGFRNGAYYAKAGGAPTPYAGGGPAEPKSGGGGNPYAPPVRPTPPPAPPAPPAPPPASADPYGALAPGVIDQRATDLANAGLSPQQAEIRRQQALAAANAKADEGAITGLQTAAGDLMGKLGPQAESGFLAASKQEGDLGQGLATGAQSDVASRVAADQAFAESQGQSGGSNVNQPGLHDVVYGLNGQIPGDTFAEQGAAANQWGLSQAPIALNAGREELTARMAQARTENDGYAQQLIQLAAQFPGLKAQALQQLNQYELDKANYREQVAHTKTADKQNQEQIDTQKRSERAQEIAAGIDATNKQGALAYKWASLQFQSQKAVQAAKTAAAKGHQIDAAASKVSGHLVDKQGRDIHDASGALIPLAPSVVTGSARGKAIAARGKAVNVARTSAFKYSTTLRGKPVVNKNRGAFGGKGQFIADPKYASIAPGKPGAVYHTAYGQPHDIATTDRPGRAAYSGGAGNYADAQTKVWAYIGGDSLMARFGLSREQVMTIVNKSLAAAGWKRK